MNMKENRFNQLVNVLGDVPKEEDENTDVLADFQETMIRS